jgi:hypothetical protein
MGVINHALPDGPLPLSLRYEAMSDFQYGIHQQFERYDIGAYPNFISKPTCADGVSPPFGSACLGGGGGRLGSLGLCWGSGHKQHSTRVG